MTIPASSASVADLTTAQSAASSGDTITVPAGDVTWIGGFTVTKNLTFQGAGPDLTIIRGDPALTGLFFLGTTSSYIKGFTLIQNSSVGSASCIHVRGQNVRVSHCRMVGGVTKVLGILCSGATGIPHPTGVCWNCTFEGARAVDCEGDLANGHKIWANTDAVHALGGSVAWFVEDCRIEKVWNVGQNMFDHAYGGHTVIRYCTIVDASCYMHGFHPSFPNVRGTRMVEFYNNVIRQEKLVMGDPPYWTYSGTGVVWGNSITGTWGGGVDMFLLDYTDVSGKTAGDYPLRDQPGRSTDASLWDGTGAGPAQVLVPFYEWNNTLNGGNIDFEVKAGREDFIQAGRDFYNDTVMPGYTPYTYPHPLRAELPSFLRAKTVTATTLNIG